MSFNELTDAEAERLALLIEEAGEVIQAVGKILRHGYESINPDLTRPTSTNRGSLAKELGDLLHAIERLGHAGDVDMAAVTEFCKVKAGRIAKYLHHQSRAMGDRLT